MSKPIDIPNIPKERTISEDFNSKSENSKQIILGFTCGAKPSIRDSQTSYSSPRRRIDSIDFSPVTKSLLSMHGIDKIPLSLINKNVKQN